MFKVIKCHNIGIINKIGLNFILKLNFKTRSRFPSEKLASEQNSGVFLKKLQRRVVPLHNIVLIKVLNKIKSDFKFIFLKIEAIIE